MEEKDADGRAAFHLLRAFAVEFGLRQGEFAGQHGLHPTDVRALICLLDAARAGTGATPGWLGARLGLNSAGTTGLVDRLVRLGYVRRERDGDDRRRVLLTVDARAVELGQEHFGPMIREFLELLGAFDDGERAVIHRFLAGAHAVARRRE